LKEEKLKIYTTRIETPIGTMIAGAVGQGICLLEFSDRKTLEAQIRTLTDYLNAEIKDGKNEHFGLLRHQLKEYFKNKLKVFTIPMITPGTDFQQLVWNELQRIPHGSTRSYKQQACAINKPSAIRAVAKANGLNRISIIIPCHRVIGDDGDLTGYGGGLQRKRWLIDHESRQVEIDF
jgi:AraC family transcriptional regulator, regulatory protein of adaptative response / methylated-DNA-[protein]-cysteine methyltransferase